MRRKKSVDLFNPDRFQHDAVFIKIIAKGGQRFSCAQHLKATDIFYAGILIEVFFEPEISFGRKYYNKTHETHRGTSSRRL